MQGYSIIIMTFVFKNPNEILKISDLAWLMFTILFLILIKKHKSF